MQAWRQECRREMSCYEHPAVPRKAYLITMPTAEDKAKREYSIRQLEALGLEIEVVDGINTTHYVSNNCNRVHPGVCSRLHRVTVASLVVKRLARCR